MSNHLVSSVLAALVLVAAPAVARGADTPTPRPRPDAMGASHFVEGPHKHSLTDIPNMSNAVPVNEMGRLPTTEDRYRTLKSKVEKAQPDVESARKKSETLNAQAESLRKRLIATAARVQSLEATKLTLDGQIAKLSAKEARLSKDFARDRVAVSHLLGLLERLQHDMPPVLALTSNDALSAARTAMLLGASLPRVYGAAAALSRRLETMRQTRRALVERRAESARNAALLSGARQHLNQLLATKAAEADTATAQYEKLATKFAVIARQAADLGQLLQKVEALRAEKFVAAPMVFVGPGDGTHLGRGSLRRPVVGRLIDGGIEGVGGARAPGVTFLTQPGAQVVAPADSKVLFAGPYHKTGQVLILEMAGRYDLVLAGLGRVDVRVGDRVLEGEPLGSMPNMGRRTGLYFEVRHNGRGMSPAPWLEVGL